MRAIMEAGMALRYIFDKREKEKLAKIKKDAQNDLTHIFKHLTYRDIYAIIGMNMGVKIFEDILRR